MSTELRPTPETDAMSCRILHRELCDADFARKLERERNSAKTLNRTLLDQLEAQAVRIEAMREAIKEACEALADLAERWEETPEWHNMAEHNSAWCGKIFTNVRQCKKSHDALAKLNPLKNYDSH